MRNRIGPIFAFLLPVVLAGAPQADFGNGHLSESLHALARPLQHSGHLTPLLYATGDARLVLLGEASHGTREFYSWRDRLSRRLVRERGFDFIAIEGDWSSLLPLDRYVRHQPAAPSSAHEALLQIDRWPRWLWANSQLEALGEWLREFNQGLPPGRRVGIHGIDLYDIWESMDAVQAFYRRYLPQSATRVHQLYRPLRGFRDRYRDYAGYVLHTGRSARTEVAWVAHELAERYRNAAPSDRDPVFEALQHARVVESGERYLRKMTLSGPQSWNARARHFERTVTSLLDHYGPGSRAIIWAHNTHIGDARATDMVGAGEVNLGQLVRERFGRDAVFALGFGTATGSVLAAREWEGARETMVVPWPRPDSLEAALLAAGDGDRVLLLDRVPPGSVLRSLMLPHRAIGVVFRPEDERGANYVPTRLADRYDAFVFLPFTRALTTLASGAARPGRNLP